LIKYNIKTQHINETLLYKLISWLNQIHELSSMKVLKEKPTHPSP